MARGARSDGDCVRRQAGSRHDTLLCTRLGCEIEPLLGEAPALFSDALSPNPEALLARSSHCGDDARFELALLRDVEAISIPVAFESRRDRLLVGFPALGRVGDTVQGQAHGADVVALGALGEVARPGLDLVGDGFAIGEDPPIIRFERDILALHILAGRRRAGNATGIGHHLDHSGLVAGRQLTSPADRLALPRRARASSARTAASCDLIGFRARRCRRPSSSSAAACRGRQEPRPLFIPAAGDRRPADDLLRGRRLGKRRHATATGAHLVIETGGSPAPRLAGINDRATRGLDLLDPPGDLRIPVHRGS